MTPTHTHSNSRFYHATLVPALHEIQHQYGYLKREALEELSRDSGVPLYRIQAVASFFPHFLLAPPRKVVVKVCRDMACHMNGAAQIISELQAMAGEHVTVEGVSCAGRCDRPPAVCVTLQGSHHEHYYLGQPLDRLKRVVEKCLQNAPPSSDRDIRQHYLADKWMANPYAGGSADYAGVRKAIAARDASIHAASSIIAAKSGWGPGQTEQFRFAAIQQLHVDFTVDPEVAEAVRCWQTEADWAKGPELGGWAEVVMNELKDADLRGMGGAGIPATQKWRDVRDTVRTARHRQTDDRAFIVVNGDESEPGTFKDRELLLRSPFLVIEGVILAGLVTEASQGFIYIRHEYTEQIEACRAEIRRAEELGFCGEKASVLGRPFPISVFVSPGGYICGEQSALIEAMSDHRGEPRNMPPKLETNGLQDLPTLVSNVETFAWVPYIWIKGGKTYASLGVNGWKGRRFFSVSGDVKKPGVYEVPMGMTLRELLYGEEYCGGIAGDRKLKAFAPSGPSGGFLPAKLTAGNGLPRDHTKRKEWQELAQRRGFDPASNELDILDLELELNLFRALSPTQALGAGLIVYAEGRDMPEQAVNALEFFRNESCGKCVPCRMGSQKLASLGDNLVHGKIEANHWKEDLLPLIQEMSKAIELASICGLGRSVPMPLRTVGSFFEDDINKHLSGSNGAHAPAQE